MAYVDLAPYFMRGILKTALALSVLVWTSNTVTVTSSIVTALNPFEIQSSTGTMNKHLFVVK